MSSSAHRRVWVRRALPLWLLLSGLLTSCGVTGNPLSTSIDPLPGEDIAGACSFDLSMAQPAMTQKGVLVIYERGDSDALYNDATLRNTVRDLDYSLVWAHQCNSRSSGDLQADASKGPARMLFAALHQFAVRSGHAELATAGVVLYGFSAAGVLTATMADQQPGRLIAVIQYAAGSAYTDLNDVAISAAAAQLPTLILANASDPDSGTTRSLGYFERGRAMQGPWAYAVQNDTAHCCNLSTRGIILPWLNDIAAAHASGGGAQASPAYSVASGTLASFVCTPDGVEDAQEETDCRFTAASLGGAGKETSGWLPSEASGAAWLAWVTNPATN